MSSSSTTACSRSPSPTPTTPEAIDIVEPMMSQEELSAWCKSLPNAEFLVNGDIQFGEHVKKLEERPALNLEDLLQEHVYEDVTPAAHSIPSETMFCPVTSPSSPVSSTAGIAASRPSIASTKPVPPPPQVRKDPPALQRVVCPQKETCYNLPIMFPSLPEGGTKSRVETQIRLTVDLAHASSSSGEPHKYDKVGSWKWLRLPKGTTTKKRTRKEGKVDAPSEESLYLTAEITCATPPHTRVTVCSSCQTREAKRVARKIAARVRPARSDSESQEEPLIIPGKGKHEDTSNILQFNCPEVLDFSSGSVILPLRITCYCRHHREKVGFNLHFTMLDHTGRVVGTGSTKPIMITDDHKSTGVSTQKGNSEFGAKLDWTVAGMESQEGAPKRKKTTNGTERAKKRAKPYDAGSRVSRLHRQSSSGSLHSPSEMTSAFATRASSPLQQNALSQSQLQIATSAASPTPSSYSFTDQPPSSVSAPPNDVLDSGASTAVASPSLSGFESNVSIADFINSNFNVDVAMADCSDMDSPPVAFHDPSHSPFLTAHQPSVPVPPSMMESMNMAMPVPAPPPVPVPYMLFKHDPPPPLSLPPPRIHRLIPAAGPTFGGIEITVLGANFHPSMQLNCMFGGSASTSTQRWSDNTLVCILPPSVVPGQVHVWFEGLPKEEDGSPPCLFTYTDETDRALMELALQVVGLKMTGKIEDARNIAMRIVGNTGGPEPDGNMHAGGAMQLSSHLLLGRAGDNREFEKTLIDFLTVLDVPADMSSASSQTESTFISKPTASGQTLLHLATLAKFPSLVKFLIAHGIDIDARDQNGCTALFLAALTSSTECARTLVDAGAALDVVNAAGRTPAEVGPAGFFDSMTSDSERSSEGGDHDEDEATWGDGEEESDLEADARPVKRRGGRKGASLRLLRPRSTPAPVSATPEVPQGVNADHKATPSSADKKAVEAGFVAADEKQAATFTETLYRTLAQLQDPQGMIANIPNFPLLHMPNLPGLPGMPAWGTFAQIPVFPVLVPIQQLWGDRRGRGADEKPEGSDPGAEQNGQQARMSVLSPQDWRAFWEKWMQQATATARRDADAHDNPPPAYTPRNTNDSAPLDPDTKEPAPVPAAEVASATANEPSASCPVSEAEAEVEVEVERLGAERAVPRQVGYGDAAVPEEEVQLYGYRPTRKPARRAQKKHDRMLVLFWIPILIIGFAWAFLHALRIALHTTKALVTLKVGLNA